MELKDGVRAPSIQRTQHEPIATLQNRLDVAEREVRFAIASLTGLIEKSRDEDQNLVKRKQVFEDWLRVKCEKLAELKRVTSETASSTQSSRTGSPNGTDQIRLEKELGNHAKKWEDARDKVSRFLREAQYQTFVEWLTENHRDYTKRKPSGIVDLFVRFLRDERCRVSTELSQNQKDTRLLVLGATLLNQGDVTSDDLANVLSGRLDRYAETSDYTVFKPRLDIREDAIEPDERADQGKLCYYEATANANFVQGQVAQVLQDTQLLRDHYWIAYDEDFWADALAEFYGFRLSQQRVTYVAATDAIGQSGTRGQLQFLLIVLPIEPDDEEDDGKKKSKKKTAKDKKAKKREASGHAIFATNVNGTVKVIDNEFRDQSQIDPKHKNRRITVYRRTQTEADANRRLSADERLERLSSATIEILKHAMFFDKD